MIDDHRLAQMSGAIYDASGGAAPWTDVLETVCDVLGATGAHLLHFDHRHLQASVTVAARTDPDALDAYGRYFHRLDPWGTRVKPGGFAAETVIAGASLVSFDKVRRSEFYAGLGRRYGISRSLVGVIEAPSANRSAIITINRGDAAEEFDAEATRVVGALVPHLRRALARHRRLAVVRAERDGLAAALDRLRAAIVLVDAGGTVVTMNRAADELIARQDGLRVRGRRLHGETSQATAALDEIVADAIAIARGQTAAGSARAALPKRSDGRPLEALALPLPPGDQIAARAAAAVFVIDPNEMPVVPTDWLTTRFHLTPAEARIASALARGEELADIAARLRVTTGTARWYVKQILAKTGTKRQADLVRLLVGIVVGLGAG
jgi:DNA-binding CsgD family transcriptional regulator